MEKFRDVLPLIGYMDEDSARDFLTNDSVTNKSPDQIATLIRACRAVVLAKPVADFEAKTSELPSESGGLLDEIKRDDRFPKTVEDWRWSFREVEIDKLICIQRYIDVAYADDLARKLDLSTAEGRVRFCLTDAFRTRESELFEVPREFLYAVKADGYDIRVMRSGASFDPKTGDRTVTMTVGWGHPYVQVAKLKGRYVLKNGYHRAFVLRRLGFDSLPCIMLETNTYNDLECTGPPTFFSERAIMGAHPPVFSGFFDEKISPPTKMRTLEKAIVIRPDTTVLETEAMVDYMSNDPIESKEPRSDNLEYINIRPIHEEWNVYRLPDGTILKLRAALTRVKRLEANATRGAADISNIMLVCNPPRGSKGPPGLKRPTPEELLASIVEKDVKFKVLGEPLNEYVTSEGKRMMLRLKLYNLAKTNRFDPNGDPLYLYNAKPDLIMVDK